MKHCWWAGRRVGVCVTLFQRGAAWGADELAQTPPRRLRRLDQHLFEQGPPVRQGRAEFPLGTDQVSGLDNLGAFAHDGGDRVCVRK